MKNNVENIGIPFNKPFISGNEIEYVKKSVEFKKISGDGYFTKRCNDFFTEKYGFNKVLLTTSCTDALEMASILVDIQPGDEVIIPSFTFVSTANAFVLRGAVIKFADSCVNHPNIDHTKIESLITEKTKAIIVVHYGGVACEMDAIMDIAKRNNLIVIEDAAQAIDSYYKGKPLGSIGHLGTFSFHETKNIISGEGGMLVVNDESFALRSEIIREKGTNRSQFFRGEVDKYGWMDIGSSFLPSDLIAAFLFGQLEQLDNIQNKRKLVWNKYYEGLKNLDKKGLIRIVDESKVEGNNGHLFYLICDSNNERTQLIETLKEKGIMCVFHYLSLHKSPFYESKHDGRELPNADEYSDRLLRLPLFYDITENEVDFVIKNIQEFYA
jgi:dTDP-4-amino-4,6-dideoxygalactose transaminase